MNSVAEILNKGKKEKLNSTISGDHCGVLKALKAVINKNGDHLTLDKELGVPP